MKESFEIVKTIVVTALSVNKEILAEFIIDTFTATKAARKALRELKRECKSHIHVELDCNGGYIVTVKKLHMELHISREGTVREAEMAEALGILW